MDAGAIAGRPGEEGASFSQLLQEFGAEPDLDLAFLLPPGPGGPLLAPGPGAAEPEPGDGSPGSGAGDDDPGGGRDPKRRELAPGKKPAGNEKNRNAQKRYRERQKETLQHFKTQVEELSQQVSQLLQDKSSLQTRNQLLERVVSIRDDEPENGKGRPHELVALHRVMAAYRNAIHAGKTNYTEADALTWTSADLAKAQLEGGKEMMACLLEARDDPSCPYYQRIDQIITLHRTLVQHLFLMDCKMVNEITRELKRTPAPLDCTQKTLVAMQLTNEQKQRLLEIRANLLNDMTALLRQRREAVQILADANGILSAFGATPSSGLLQPAQATLPAFSSSGFDMIRMPGTPPTDEARALPADNLLPPNPSYPGVISYHVRTTHALEATETLQGTLEAEHRAVGRFVSAILAPNFLSSMQLARGIVESYPHLVDHLLICNIIAAETRGVQAVPLEGKQGVGIKTEGAAPGDMAADELTQLLKRQPNGHLLMPIGCSFRTLTDAPHMPYSAPPPDAFWGKSGDESMLMDGDFMPDFFGNPQGIARPPNTASYMSNASELSTEPLLLP